MVYDAAGSLIIFAFAEVLSALIVMGGIFLIIMAMLRGSKSQQHRKLLTNLYVAGKIRQIANKDDIDLNVEMKELLKTIKEQKKYDKSLDDIIEIELKDKIIKEAESDKKEQGGQE